ncbi:MAG: hypothetical protein IJS65_08930 [Clostridia bacterium]|nr:hypothetical protein [Clostridia bacterium]
MKANVKTLLVITAVVLALLAGCSRAEKTDDVNVGVANPWTQSDKQGVLEATGFEMTPPEGAADVSYSYMEKDKLAQMTYTLDGAEWVYRMQPADKLTDISGMYYEWKTEKGEVAGREAVFQAWTDAQSASQTVDGAKSVQVVCWYDAVTGVAYSLSASGDELNGMDIKVYAENVYSELQGESAGDADAEKAEELETYFLGEHSRKEDGSTLTITEKEDGTFKVDISIVRLCNLEDGEGTFEDHKMSFSVTDPAGNAMGGVIYRDSDNTLTVKITVSFWDLLPSGEVLEGFAK